MQWTNEIQKALNEVLKAPVSERVAVFDADGTLWKDDIGEAFFQFQISSQSAPGIKGLPDPWKHYLDMTVVNPPEAYVWLAQINAGLQETDLKKQCSEFYKSHFKSKPFPLVRSLIDRLKEASFDIWICTASIRWSAEPLMTDLGLPPGRLIASAVEVNDQGALTSSPCLPIPYAQGKKMNLEAKLGKPPLLVAGNSMGDFEMLELATKLPLVIVFKPHLKAVEESEKNLMAKAVKQGWPIQIFQ